MVKWYAGKLTKDVGRYKAGRIVPFKHKAKGRPTDEDYGHVFAGFWGPYNTKRAAWEAATVAQEKHG